MFLDSGAAAGAASEIPTKIRTRESDRRFVNIMAVESILSTPSHRDHLALLETIDAPCDKGEGRRHRATGQIKPERFHTV